MLKKSFIDWHKEEWSSIQPGFKTDKVASLVNEEIYPKHVVDASGKFIGGKPFFILWPKWFRMNDHISSFSLHNLAKHFDGKIAFRFADFYTDENLRMTYEIY